MDILERDEQIGICQLLHNALGKLKLIDLNPVNDDLLDPTGAYSIGDLLRQNISHLEHFYQAVDEIDSTEKRFLRESITNSQDDNGENQFSQWQFTKQCMEIKKLETNLADMEKIFENLHQERHVSKCRIVKLGSLIQNECNCKQKCEMRNLQTKPLRR